MKDQSLEVDLDTHLFFYDAADLQNRNSEINARNNLEDNCQSQARQHHPFLCNYREKLVPAQHTRNESIRKQK